MECHLIKWVDDSYGGEIVE